MTHWRKFHDDNELLHAYDLPDGVTELTVEIEKVEPGELTGEKGRKSKKPIIHFVGKKKVFGANKTCCKTIARLYGNNVEQWINKKITLYVTQTEYDGSTTDCLRVRPTVPK